METVEVLRWSRSTVWAAVSVYGLCSQQGVAALGGGTRPGEGRGPDMGLLVARRAWRIPRWPGPLPSPAATSWSPTGTTAIRPARSPRPAYGCCADADGSPVQAASRSTAPATAGPTWWSPPEASRCVRRSTAWTVCHLDQRPGAQRGRAAPVHGDPG